MIKFYCQCCDKHQEVYPVELKTDNLNKGVAWDDVVCKECNFVIATISSDESGKLLFALQTQSIHSYNNGMIQRPNQSAHFVNGGKYENPFFVC